MTARRAEKRGWVFNVCLYAVCILNFIVICFGISACFATYFEVSNESVFPEIGTLFRTLSLKMRGFCWKPLGSSNEQCRLVPFWHLFYDMPKLSFPSTVQPEQLQRVLENFGGQNPILFYGVFVSVITSVAGFINALRIRGRPIRRLGVYGVVLTLANFIVSCVTYGVTHYVYGTVVIDALSRPISVVVERNGQETTVTGRLSDVGIRFKEGDGAKELICMIVFSLFAVIFSCRLLTKTKKKEDWERDNL